VETQIGPLQIPKAGYNTAVVLDFFNKVFDSVNAHTLRPETPLRVAVIKNSKHHDFWLHAIKLLSDMRYVDPKTKQPVKCIPSLKNWIFTLRGFQNIWKIVNNAGIQFLKTRNLNQDPLENFFGMIRSHGHRNTNPSCSQFCGSYKTLLINNLTSKRSMGSNCEDKNDGDLLFNLKQFVKNISHVNSTSEQMVEEDSVSSQNKTIIHQTSSHKNNSKMYVAGWIAKKILSLKQFKNCLACKQSLLTTDITSEEYIHLIHREYVREKPSLTYPSMSFFKHAFITDDSFLNKNISLLFRRNVSALLYTLLNEKLSLDFIHCNTHKKELKDVVIKKIINCFYTHFVR